MKKVYESPAVEKMEFNYKETVVASNQCGTPVYAQDIGPGTDTCWKEGEILD